jgi:hypothetical protein
MIAGEPAEEVGGVVPLVHHSLRMMMTDMAPLHPLCAVIPALGGGEPAGQVLVADVNG